MISSTDKGWKVELNKSTLPTLFVQEDFAEEVKNNNKTDNDKKFVNDLLIQRVILRAVEQRNSTTLKIAVEILKAKIF